MIKAESKAAERNLRSASPHRNAYKSDFQAIKCSFDGPKSESVSKNVTNGSSDSREESRGRPFGTRVNKIKNIFLQMDGQQEYQEGKPNLKPDVPQTSPTKMQFPINAHKVSFNSASSPESLDKTPKGDEVEIDKVALAEKFSVTRKLFERGIKEKAVTEKQPSNRVVNRLSFGSASEEGKSTRRVSGCSETLGKVEQTPGSTVKSHAEEMADGEKRHAPRVSLNAGPISKRLENYMVENDAEDNHASAGKEELTSAKQHVQPTSPTRDSLHKTTSSVKEAADSVNNVANKNKDEPAPAGSSFGLKPTYTSLETKSVSLTADTAHKLHSSEETTSVSHGYKFSSSPTDRLNRTSVGGDEAKPHSPPPKDEKQSLTSTEGSQHADSAKYQEKAKRKDGTTLSCAGDKPPIQPSVPETRVGSTVRAELVVVQNESSESEDNEDENVEDQKNHRDLKRSSGAEKSHFETDHQRGADTVNEGRLLEDDEEEKEEDGFVVSQDGEDDEAADEEATPEKQVDRASPAVYGIENAAFVDDRDVDQVIREEEEKEEVEADEEDQTYEEYDDCYEAPGLSDEDEPPPKRKIKFSTDPIWVSVFCCLCEALLLI